MSFNNETKLLAGRRRSEDRRKSASGANTHALERRFEMQRRVLNLDALSVDEWLADHQPKDGFSRQVGIISE